MSFAEPVSLDKTARTPPTGRAFMPRMSSMSGPGQKLPRASISLSMVISVSSGMVITPFKSIRRGDLHGCPQGMGAWPVPQCERERGRATARVAPTFLDEQGHLSFFSAINESGDSGDFCNDGFQVFEFHVKEFHGHTAGIDFDIPDFHGAFESLHPGGDFLRHHLLHHDRAILFEIFTDAHVGLVSILAERFQTPECNE